MKCFLFIHSCRGLGVGLDSKEFRTIMGMKCNVSNERLVSDTDLNSA